DPAENQWYGPHAHAKRIGSTAGLFNMYAYGTFRLCSGPTQKLRPSLTLVIGFLVRCLHASIPLHWAIKSNKAKDDPDFSLTAKRIRPSTSDDTHYDTTPYGGLAWGYGTNEYWDEGNSVGYPWPAWLDFYGGPFIIEADFADRA